MKIGFETIGNATLIVRDQSPQLVTDPWISPDAYFGSWSHTHEIPEKQKAAILACPFVWFSHGHPDHLNPDSLPYFKNKTILLPDHLGSRIATTLKGDGYKVQILKDRKWYPISKNVRVLSWSDPYQDAILLININGRLLINCNDAVDFGRENFISRLAKQFKSSFLFSISSLGIADMLNYYDEKGKFVEPEGLLHRPPAGTENARKTERFGAKYFVPSSSFHEFQRTDSAWANKYSRPESDLYEGFHSDQCEILPAFLAYDCERDTWEQIDPKPLDIILKSPESFGDNWSDALEKKDWPLITNYFNQVEHLKHSLEFINFRVGGKDHLLNFGSVKNGRGISFEVPRNSLMTAIDYHIFEDLLIGNFMKTTLHGNWPTQNLCPEFSVYVGKYADNGFAYTEKEVKKYLNTYSLRFLEFKGYYWYPRIRSFLGGLLRQIPAYQHWKTQTR